jgi:S1-C subfamily serine protease
MSEPYTTGPMYNAPPPPPHRPPPPPPSRTPVLLAILLGLLIGWMVYRWVDNYLARGDAQPRPVTPRASLTDLEKTNIQIFENASPSVAYIISMAVRRDLFGLNVQNIPQGAGSGFVWDQNGHIVTNYHVVHGAENGNVTFDVTLSDHSAWRGRIIGVAPENDLAVLKIPAPATRLHPVTIGSSNDLQVGQLTFAIGNPFGLDQTLTTGVVSALGRQIPTESGRTIKDVIQTDAAVNPGNSGGPLLDSAARLIGVNTAIYSPSGASAGIGFAIPVDTVNRVVPQLIAHGQVIRPEMGVSLAHDSITRRMHLTGALIFEVEPNSGASEAGLRGMRKDPEGNLVLGDVIKAIDGKPVKSVDELLSILETHKSGDVVHVTILRGDEEKKVDVTLR